MKNKKILMIGMFFLMSIILIGLVSASFCCEKTKEGAWCQPKDSKNDCDLSEGLGYSQTGCESTAYCKLGTCIDSEKGICSPNSPQKNCNGLWLDKKITEVSQCEEACCVIGTTSFLDTLGGCKKQAENYGLEVDFRKNIKNELECSILSASNVKGACVLDDNSGIKTCNLKTEKECMEMKQIDENVSFHKNTLCSATKLGTNCGASKKTICSDGKVYFVDSCGNLANIYDAKRQDDAIYWTNVFSDDDVACDNGEGNKNSATCGLCDDWAGSICGTPTSTKPKIGNYICRDMSCKYNGKTYQNGARWCALEADGNKGTKNNLPGSEHFILGCYDGEVSLIEDCSAGDWRNKICVDSVVAGVENAGCVVNNWHDCIQQTEKKDCLNNDERDCVWVENEFGLDSSRTNVKCVPKYAPGFDFWNSESEATTDCAVASKTVQVVYKKGATTEFAWECDSNCWALNDDWINKMNKVCNAVGDCGSSVNYIGQKGWYDIKDLWSKK